MILDIGIAEIARGSVIVLEEMIQAKVALRAHMSWHRPSSFQDFSVIVRQ